MPAHEHAFRRVREVRAPVGHAPGHTIFLVLACTCGVVDVFPRSNYALADAPFRRDFEAGLTQLGFSLETEGRAE